MRRFTVALSILSVLLLVSMPTSVFAQGPGKPGKDNGNGQGSNSGNAGNCDIQALPSEPLSLQEIDALTHMREEEKLARDLYLSLFDIWGLRSFQNIAGSEQRHMDAVATLLDKYGLQDPALEDIGSFANPELTALYDQLLSVGMMSLQDALWVGATVEDLDLFDLYVNLEAVDNQDIQRVFENLSRGSRNHLRSFTQQLDALGFSYTAQYLTQEQIDEILASEWERGSGKSSRKGSNWNSKGINRGSQPSE
jgi:hypothetical protein